MYTFDNKTLCEFVYLYICFEYSLFFANFTPSKQISIWVQLVRTDHSKGSFWLVDPLVAKGYSIVVHHWSAGEVSSRLYSVERSPQTGTILEKSQLGGTIFWKLKQESNSVSTCLLCSKIGHLPVSRMQGSFKNHSIWGHNAESVFEGS